MIPDAEAEEPDPRGGPRVAFQIVLSSSVRPTPATGLQSVFAGTLLLFTLASCLQLGLAANVHLLPKVDPFPPPSPLTVLPTSADTLRVQIFKLDGE